jgi:hypothetical protein
MSNVLYIYTSPKFVPTYGQSQMLDSLNLSPYKPIVMKYYTRLQTWMDSLVTEKKTYSIKVWTCFICLRTMLYGRLLGTW